MKFKLIGLAFAGPFLFVVAAFASEIHYDGPRLTADYEGPVVVDNSRFRYPPAEMLSFRMQDYLERHARNLLSVRPTLDTWAARFGIHPRVLTAVVLGYFGDAPVSANRENIATILELAAALHQVFEQQAGEFLAASRAVDAVARAYGLHISLPADLAQPLKLGIELRASGGPPLFGYFQPPWEPGETWAGGGAHGGGGGAGRNSLDFWGTFQVWGEDTSPYWVTAAQSGIVRVWSSCFVSVIYPNGWVTSYYHLDNIQVTDTQTVNVNDRLANYADNLPQAICQGGSALAPHVHFSINYYGNPVLIDQANVDFTSWSHRVGHGNYDIDCARSFYTILEDSSTVCPNFDRLPNDSLEPSERLFSDSFESGTTSAWNG